MSKTDKTKPAKYQIADLAAAHGGHIDYRRVAWRRYKGHGEFIAKTKNRKNKDWKDNYDY